MNILDSIEAEIDTVVKAKDQRKFDIVQREESAELLDNLGYGALYKDDESLTEIEIFESIQRFREECELHREFVSDYIEMEEEPIQDELSEFELDFLSNLSSLEGKFPLHDFDQKTIKSNTILSRVLNFRLNVLLSEDKLISSAMTVDTSNRLNQLSALTQISNRKKLIRLSGDITALSVFMAEKKSYADHNYHHIVYFENRPDTKEERRFIRNCVDPARFALRLTSLPQPSRDDFEPFLQRAVSKSRLKKNQIKTVEAIQKTNTNKFMVRLLQIRLWLMGSYQGRLDSYLGPVSFQSIQDFLNFAYYGLEDIDNIPIKESDILLYLKQGYWALNITFFIRVVIPLLIKQESDHEPKTLTRQIDQLVEATETEEHANRLILVIDDEIAKEFNPVSVRGIFNKKRRKKKIRGGKGFFRAIRKFFNKVISLVKTAFEEAIKVIKKLFKWIKNGAKTLVREIKAAFRMLKSAVNFVFSKRVIKTTSKDKKSEVITDFDFDFDSTTHILGSPSHDMFAEHTVKNREKLNALTDTMDFLSKALPWVIQLAKGPLGWIKLGIKLIREIVSKEITKVQTEISVFNLATII